MGNIYLDYAATSPVDSEVLHAMQPYFSTAFGNASSLHADGIAAKEALNRARSQIAAVLGCALDEVICTSGGTEANNLAMIGIAEANNFSGHVIISAIEHHSILETAAYLETRGMRVSRVSVDTYGMLDPAVVMREIADDTVLVSVQYANNEIGTIQPIAAIGTHIEQANKNRANQIVFHSDAVQAPGMLDLSVAQLHVGAMSISGHKCYGPKGVGILFRKRNVPLVAQLHGGGQERKMRAGTENVPAIVGMACALTKAANMQSHESARLSALRDSFLADIKAKLPKAIITGHRTSRLPHIASFCIPGHEGDALVARLSEKGFSCAAGSACSAGDFRASHVLQAIGVPGDAARGSVRVSLGRTTTHAHVRACAAALAEIV